MATARTPAPGGTETGASGATLPPALTEVEKSLARSDYRGAVLAVFPLVMVDVERAFGTEFPAHWTARDVLAHGIRGDSGNLPSLLLELYALYEPVRFGQESDWVRGDVLELVRRIYSETALGKRREPPISSPPPTGMIGRARPEPPAAREGRSW
jgi:hypothetical protein